MTARLVDDVLMYDCPYSGKSYILVVQNAIYVPSMENNLNPPFMMREAGIVVNERPKSTLMTQRIQITPSHLIPQVSGSHYIFGESSHISPLSDQQGKICWLDMMYMS